MAVEMVCWSSDGGSSVCNGGEGMYGDGAAEVEWMVVKMERRSWPQAQVAMGLWASW